MLFGCARLLNGQSSTPNSNRGCQPALYGTGRLAVLATGYPDRFPVLCLGFLSQHCNKTQGFASEVHVKPQICQGITFISCPDLKICIYISRGHNMWYICVCYFLCFQFTVDTHYFGLLLLQTLKTSESNSYCDPYVAY